MSKMNEKKEYVSQLATFLSQNDKTMSGEELAEHLNRNDFLTSYGSEYKGGRGTYRLIRETYHWLVGNELQSSARHVARAYVTPDGKHAYETQE